MNTVCVECGFYNGAHGTTCPRVAAAVSQMSVPTAYERDRQSLQDRLFKVECASDVLLKRLLRALQRIDALELDVARLRCLQFPEVAANTGPVNILPSTAELWTKSNQGDQQEASAKGPRSIGEVIASRLPCGCPHPHCQGHQFVESPVLAYPPLPDEGT